MYRPLLVRWTDTAAHRLMLVLAGILVLPVLGMGVVTTLLSGVVILTEPLNIGLEQLVFALLSIGGALGILGYVRAHLGAREPDRHNVTATLVCLAVGTLVAFAVAGFVVAQAVASWRAPWSRNAWLGLAALFAAANLVWALAGVAWMQRLPCCYAAKTGRVFDSLPVVLLLLAIALAIAAVLTAAAL